MNKKITQLRWLVAMIMLVAAMVMPSTAWAQESTVTFTAKEGTAGFSTSEGFGKLIDGKYTSEDGTKWCLNFTSNGSAYIIFSASEPIQVTGYSIVTGNDNASETGRNPKSWAIYGCNDASADRDSENWVLIDQKNDDTVLQDENYQKYDFTSLSNPPSEKYQYFKMEITAIHSGTVMQMSELILAYSPTCDHQWVDGNVVAHTCTTDGYTLQTCSRCGAEQKINIDEATGHEWGSDDICDVCEVNKSTPSKPLGDGSAENPFQIGTVGELYWFAGLVNGDASVCTGNVSQKTDACAVLTADITVNTGVLDENGDLNTGDFTSWTPIGNSSSIAYSGTFDGNNHIVSGLYCKVESSDKIVRVGFFGYNLGGTIKNVGIIDSYFELKYKGTLQGDVGGVCAGNYGSGTIINCYNKGTVTGINENDNQNIVVGGVCGMNAAAGMVKNCYNAGNVFGQENTGSNSNTGGLCGANRGIITNSYNEGNVSGGVIVGGICGKNDDSSGAKYTIVNCYNRGTVSGGSPCRSLCGLNYGYTRTQNCYYLDTTGSDSNATAKTATQFARGEVTYLLSQGCTIEEKTYEGSVWKQNIDNGAKDNYPLLDSSHGTVYAGYRHSETTPYCSNTQNNIPSDYGHLHAYNSDASYEVNGNHDKTYQSDFNWTDNDDNTDATVTATFTCAVCGKLETPEMNAVHDDDHTNVAATCTEKGYNYYKTSKSFPGETFTAVYRQEVPALGHDYSGTASINTTKQIYEKYCKRCSVFLEYCATSDGSVEAIEDPEGVFTANDLTLQDATTYDNQAVFTATNFTYTRTFSNANWTTWYVPFDLKLTSDICAKYDFSRINNVHQYDTDNDGTADKTVVESFRQMPGVTLKANYPYLVKPVSEGDLNMVLNLEGVIPALAETNSIDCQSVDFSYTFKGTYTAMGEGGSGYYNPYTLWTDGTWQHFRSLDPMRHYLTVTPRNSSFASAASLRSIMLSVIGDEGTTGIVNMYSDERKAAETYDLGGRRLPAGASQKGVMIENGKVIIKK